jgi:NAD(P)-dependent dehydrogenase (short-subunit alcohol dehydrogenase family)
MEHDPLWSPVPAPQALAEQLPPHHLGRGVVISGGTAGIGLAVARRLVAEGARVWIMGRRTDSVARALDEVGAIGGCACDVTQEVEVEGALADAHARLGSIDGAFIGASVPGERRSATEMSVEDFRRVLDVNLTGAFLVARGAARVMAPGGSIVFNGSANGFVAEPGRADHAASKAGVILLAKTMAIDLAPQGIAVTTICPGDIRTRSTEERLADPLIAAEHLARIPAGRLGEPDEIAALVTFLLRAEAAYLTGAAIPVDGGRTAG